MNTRILSQEEKVEIKISEYRFAIQFEDGSFMATNDPFIRDNGHLLYLLEIEENLSCPKEFEIYSDFMSDHDCELGHGIFLICPEDSNAVLISVIGDSFYSCLEEFGAKLDLFLNS